MFWQREKKKDKKMSVLELAVIYVLHRYSQACCCCHYKDLLLHTGGSCRSIFIHIFPLIAYSWLWMDQAEKCFQKRFPHPYSWEHSTSLFPISHDVLSPWTTCATHEPELPCSSPQSYWLFYSCQLTAVLLNLGWDAHSAGAGEWRFSPVNP